MLIIGHRGAAGLAPENTVASLQKALDHHVDMVEFDLRVTKDSVPVLHHDEYLTDSDGQKYKITETSYEELKRHKADLATLDEALQVIGKKVPCYVEVKRRENIKPIAKVLEAHLQKGWPAKNLIVGSKHQKTLMALRTAVPELPKIVIEPWSGVRAHWRARQVDTKLVSMNQRWLWWGFIRGFKHSDWQLYAYTVNDVAKAKRWQKYGLAGVVTDYPDLF